MRRLSFSDEQGRRAQPASSRRDAQIEVLDHLVGAERLDIALEDDLAVHDDVAVVGDPHRLGEILLGHQHGERVLVLELLDRRDGLVDQQRRQAHRGFVDQQQPRRGHQRPGNGQHLLLAAGHRSRQLAAPLRQHREGLEREGQVACDLRPGRRAKGAQQQVFLDRELREEPAPLGHQRDPEVDDFFGGHPGQVVARAVDLEHDAAGVGLDDAHHALHQRALAVAVGAQQRDGLALIELHRHAVQCAHRAVAGADVPDGELNGQGRLSELAGS